MPRFCGFGSASVGLSFRSCFIPRDSAGRWRLGELEAFEFDVGGGEVGEVVVGLLGEPGFGGAAENSGEADGPFGGDAAFSVDEFGESGASEAESGGLDDGEAERLDALAQAAWMGWILRWHGLDWLESNPLLEIFRAEDREISSQKN